jgi:hypothetical protein
VYARTYIYRVHTVYHYLLMLPLHQIQIELLLYFSHMLAYDIQNYLLIMPYRIYLLNKRIRTCYVSTLYKEAGSVSSHYFVFYILYI